MMIGVGIFGVIDWEVKEREFCSSVLYINLSIKFTELYT